MNKTTRYDLIRSLCRKVRGSKVAVISALPSEVREEARLAKVHDDDQDIIDVETEVRVISPALAAMVKTPTHAKHAKVDECLTPQEHRQLAADLAEYRRTYPRQPSYSRRLWLAIIRPDPFESMKRVEPVEQTEPLCEQATRQLAMG